MYKKIFAVAVLFAVLGFASFAHAYFAIPYLNITLNEHTVGGDGNFNFHIQAYGSNPHTVDFGMQTSGGSAINSTAGYDLTNFNNDFFEITQDSQVGWQDATITCSSPNNSFLSITPIAHGISVRAAQYSSIVCDSTNVSSAKTPVLVIPGVMGTDILNGSQKLWVDVMHNISDIGDQFMDPLQFNNNLTPSVPGLAVGDLVKNPFLKEHYYDLIIQEFEGQGYTEGTGATDNLFLFPYDWRYGVSDSTVNSLKQKITDIMAQTGSTKVDVVAHSTGGLLVKKYVMDNPSDNHIGKAVFVGVPNTGAPQAVKVLVEGDSFGNPFLAQSEMKKIAANLPVVYDLSPSQQYYNQKGSYVKVIDSSLLHFTTTKNLNFDEANSYLTSDHALNATALTNAHSLHSQDFDNYDMRTAGVDLYAIDGCKAGTLGTVVEHRSHGLLSDSTTYDAPIMTPGDGTVPLESATNLPIDANNKFYALKSEHGKMPSEDGIMQKIVNIISGSNLSTSNIITQDISQCHLNGKAISVFSPLTIDVTDQAGNHSGVDADGNVVNDIPNANVQVMDGHKFLYLPNDDGQTYNVSVHGTDTGTFTLKSADISNNAVTQTDVFSNVSVTTALSGSVNLGTTTTLALDTNGDGTTDQTLAPSSTLDTNQSTDDVPPATTDTLLGTMGATGYYRSDVTFSLSATDPTISGETSTGVSKTRYNLDGAGYADYTAPVVVSASGAHTIAFFSTDVAGNNEAEQTVTFMVDKTAPEASIVFDPSIKDIRFSGVDAISKTSDISVVDNGDTITLADQAGNQTVIKLISKNRKVAMEAQIKSIQYNNDSAITLQKRAMAYLWKFDKKNNLVFLSQGVILKKGYWVVATYDGKNTQIIGKDKTGVIAKTVSGLDLIQVKTQAGDLTYSF